MNDPQVLFEAEDNKYYAIVKKNTGNFEKISIGFNTKQEALKFIYSLYEVYDD